MSLHRLESPVSIEILGASTTSTTSHSPTFSLGQGRYVWKGDLPGLGLVSRRMISQINNNVETTEESAVPAVVLGLDFLQNGYRMIVCAPSRNFGSKSCPTT